MAPLVAGLFVGGRSRRMGGVPKGRLGAPGSGELLVCRQLRLCDELGLSAVVVGEARPYVDLIGTRPVLADAPAGVGPLGGLAALLRHADPHPCIALACDMPYLTVPLLERLTAPRDGEAVLAPREPDQGPWQPLFARYAPAAVLPALEASLASGERSFQAVFRRVAVTELALDASERACLRDWDTPEDIQG